MSIFNFFKLGSECPNGEQALRDMVAMENKEALINLGRLLERKSVATEINIITDLDIQIQKQKHIAVEACKMYDTVMH
jgi:hypothetical protein